MKYQIQVNEEALDVLCNKLKIDGIVIHSSPINLSQSSTSFSIIIPPIFEEIIFSDLFPLITNKTTPPRLCEAQLSTSTPILISSAIFNPSSDKILQE